MMKPIIVVCARCPTARTIGTKRPVATASSIVRSAEYACATRSGGPSSSRIFSSAARSFGAPSAPATRSRTCDSISRTASRTTSPGRNVLSDRSRTKRYPFTRDSPTSVSFTSASFCGGDQAVDLPGERVPLHLHVGEPLRACACQRVVLAGMRSFPLHPLRGQEPLARQAPEDRIDRSFSDDEIGERLEMLNDGQPIARARGDCQQDGEIETAAAKLLLPSVERHTLCHKA